MNSTSGVSSVASPYPTRPAVSVLNPNGSVQLAQSIKNNGSGALQSRNLPAARTTQSDPRQNLPFGLLLTVSQPAGNNSSANTDYQDLKSALLAGNLTAAQQAYIRLRGDLELPHSTSSAGRSNGQQNTSGAGSPAGSTAPQIAQATPANGWVTAVATAGQGGSLNVTA